MSLAKPKVLYCTIHNPCGPTYGAQLRAFHIAKQLSSFCELGLALFPLAMPSENEIAKLNDEFDYLGEFNFEHNPKRGLMDFFHQELSKNWLNTHGQRIVAEDRARFMALRDQFDYVWFHGVRIPNALGSFAWARSVLDIDDIPSTFHSSQAKSEVSMLNKVKALRKCFQWSRRERVLLERFTRIAVCSTPDKAYLGGSEQISTIPNGYEVPAQPLKNLRIEGFEIGFIGTCEYFPNRQGLEWFIGSCWQHIRQQNPRATLKLVGKGTEQYSSEIDGIFGLGWVENADIEMAGWKSIIVPLQVGGGTRIKIAEAFARKIPVVSTTLGAFGYSVSSGTELLIADEPAEFSKACMALLSDESLASKISSTAFRRFESEWSWPAIGQTIQGTIENLAADTK